MSTFSVKYVSQKFVHFFVRSNTAIVTFTSQTYALEQFKIRLNEHLEIHDKRNLFHMAAIQCDYT